MPIYHIFRFVEKMVQLVDSGLGAPTVVSASGPAVASSERQGLTRLTSPNTLPTRRYPMTAFFNIIMELITLNTMQVISVSSI